MLYRFDVTSILITAVETQEVIYRPVMTTETASSTKTESVCDDVSYHESGLVHGVLSGLDWNDRNQFPYEGLLPVDSKRAVFDRAQAIRQPGS